MTWSGLVRSTVMAVALGALALVPAAQAQAAAGKVGFVDLRRVLAATPGFAQADTALSRDLETYRSQAQGLQAQLDSAAVTFEQQAAMMSPAARDARRNELRTMQDSLESRAESLQRTLAGREQQLMGPVRQRAVAAIEQVRARDGYAMVFDVSNPASTVVTADRSLDVTDAAIAAVRAAGN